VIKVYEGAGFLRGSVFLGGAGQVYGIWAGVGRRQTINAKPTATVILDKKTDYSAGGNSTVHLNINGDTMAGTFPLRGLDMKTPIPNPTGVIAGHELLANLPNAHCNALIGFLPGGFQLAHLPAQRAGLPHMRQRFTLYGDLAPGAVKALQAGVPSRRKPCKSCVGTRCQHF
jgi:hypothetical protein